MNKEKQIQELEEAIANERIQQQASRNKDEWQLHEDIILVFEAQLKRLK